MKKFLKFDNQEAIYYEDKGILYAKIDSVFNSAGIQYNWKGDPRGVPCTEIVDDPVIESLNVFHMKISHDT